MDERRTAGLAGTALGLGLGALLMYALDPQLGARRRASVQDAVRRTVRPSSLPSHRGFGSRPDLVERLSAAADSGWDRLGRRMDDLPHPDARGLTGWLVGALAVGLAATALSRAPVRERMRRLVVSPTVRQRATIEIDARPERVYEAFARHENVPRYLTGVEAVRTLGGDRSRWIAKGPAGRRIEWNSVLTDREPGRLLAWRSEPGSPVDAEGRVRLEPSGTGTRVTVETRYRPTGGRLGHGVAGALGRPAAQDLHDDLQDMKRWIERGSDALGVDRSSVSPSTGGAGTTAGSPSWMSKPAP